ncbi:MAG: carboxypeptidase regulatory-like domain-containing protein [Proteobacteria bacterium]|nr:carboxypeptidase regulatory-like domain-containing protein [Pseudomonadota bacterium]
MTRHLLAIATLIAVTSCAHGPRGGPSSELIGALVLEGTEQPIVGAKVTLTPIEPLDGSDADMTGLNAVGYTADLGAFVFVEVSNAERTVPLRANWAYELTAEANGFYSTVERVELGKGQQTMLLEIEVIEPETFAAEPIQELNPEALKTEQGSLIELVLERMGR